MLMLMLMLTLTLTVYSLSHTLWCIDNAYEL